MNKDTIQTLTAIAMCAGYLYFLYRLQQEHAKGTPDFPTKEEMLQAIENGAANLTVTPLTQSDN
jgi:hypothetical protein